jgi:hypothetical protein
MRTLLLIPATLALTAACGFAACSMLGFGLYPREMSFAIAAALLACVAGVLPIFLARHATQLGVSQAALLGTMAHLFVAAGCVGIAILGKLPLNNAFLYWSMAFYWTSLAALVVIVNRAIRQAPVASTPQAPKA